VKISIITPVYNDTRVERAIKSILMQKFEGEIEIIVIDGGSTDETLNILKKYADKIDVLISEPDKGVYDAMNKGITLATGDIVGILNADDRYAGPYVLQKVCKIFLDEDVDACYGDLVYVDKRDRTVRYWKSGRYKKWKWLLGWMPPHPTFFVKRRVYDLYGLFDLRYSIAADYELMLRFLFKYRIKVAYIPETLVLMSIGGLSNRSVKNIIKANIEVFRAWKNNGLYYGFFVPLLKPLRKAPQFFKFKGVINS